MDSRRTVSWMRQMGRLDQLAAFGAGPVFAPGKLGAHRAWSRLTPRQTSMASSVFAGGRWPVRARRRSEDAGSTVPKPGDAPTHLDGVGPDLVIVTWTTPTVPASVKETLFPDV